MNIAAFRVRILIQKNETVTDEMGNHISKWTDYFTCWATPGSQSGGETHDAGHTEEEDSLDFTVRYCSEIAAVTSKGYRIVVGGRIYGIEHVDDMGFKRNSRKFHAVLEER